ncbi:hypothetical protein ElyMa_003600200, partial [Elysia marginata]
MGDRGRASTAGHVTDWGQLEGYYGWTGNRVGTGERLVVVRLDRLLNGDRGKASSSTDGQ